MVFPCTAAQPLVHSGVYLKRWLLWPFAGQCLSLIPPSSEWAQTANTDKCVSFSSDPSSFLCHIHHPQLSCLFLIMTANVSRVEMMRRQKSMFGVFEGHVAGLEAYGLQRLSLVVVEVAWKHAVTWLLGKLRQEVRQVSLENQSRST